MAKSKFEKKLELMFQQDFIIDTQKSHIYRLSVNRNGYFCVTQNRYNMNSGVVIEPYINQWGFKELESALEKMAELKKTLPKFKSIPGNTRLLFQLYG